jgi:heme exporter protein C
MIRGIAGKLWVAAWMAATILVGFVWVRPAEFFELGGHAAKIVFFHVPCAWIASLALLVAGYYAIQHLKVARGSGAAVDCDIKGATAMELGFLFALLATITGSIFARLQWNAYWVWNEPRMMSILIVLLIFAAYLVLRGSMDDPDKRGRLTAVYTLVSVIPLIFLLWVLPRIVPATLHEGPNQSFLMGQISSGFRIVMYGLAVPAYVGLFVWLFELRVRLSRLIWRRESILRSVEA